MLAYIPAPWIRHGIIHLLGALDILDKADFDPICDATHDASTKTHCRLSTHCDHILAYWKPNLLTWARITAIKLGPMK